jgi:hypothetical protein
MLASAGQLLPWLAGFILPLLLLRRNENRLSLILGLGFLFGCVAVWIGQRWLGLDTSHQLAMLVLLALLSVMLLARQFSGFRVHTLKLPQSPWFWILFVLISLHLLISLFDVLNRPLFPWDAWTTWSYRAKAWFLAGELKKIVTPELFWRETPGEVYTIGASYYPDFTSIYQYWSALTSNVWGEQWILISWWLVGIAIVLGIYGLGRTLRFSTTISVLFSYIFISMPMIGIHTTLAGYSDLWMAGYVGLGYSIILVGLIRRSWRTLVLGIVLCSIAMLVKREGVVWFFLMTFILFVHFVPLKWLIRLVIGAFVTSIAILWLFDLDAVLVNQLQGGVVLPVVGAFKFQINPVVDALARNLFLMGNWNLFWYLLLSALVVALFNWRKREVRIALSVIIWPLLSILSLFLFTDHGAWAKDFTAINRLFIHFIPAWLLSMGVIYYEQFSPSSEEMEC